MSEKRLTRSTNDRVFLGVLGGLAEYFNMDPTVLRIIYVLVSFFSTGFPGLLVYLLLAVFMPMPEMTGNVNGYEEAEAVNGFSDEEIVIKKGS
jgi:phage shock protein C